MYTGLKVQKHRAKKTASKLIFGIRNFRSGALPSKMLDLLLLKKGWGVFFSYFQSLRRSSNPTGRYPNPFPIPAGINLT